MIPALQNAIKRLQSAFSSYGIRSPMEACPCCVHREDQNRLLAKPLNKLTSDDLSHYILQGDDDVGKC